MTARWVGGCWSAAQVIRLFRRETAEAPQIHEKHQSLFVWLTALWPDVSSTVSKISWRIASKTTIAVFQSTQFIFSCQDMVYVEIETFKSSRLNTIILGWYSYMGEWLGMVGNGLLLLELMIWDFYEFLESCFVKNGIKIGYCVYKSSLDSMGGEVTLIVGVILSKFRLPKVCRVDAFRRKLVLHRENSWGIPEMCWSDTSRKDW